MSAASFLVIHRHSGRHIYISRIRHSENPPKNFVAVGLDGIHRSGETRETAMFNLAKAMLQYPPETANSEFSIRRFPL